MAKVRDSIIDKIEKLMRRTREKGASEAEAEVALRMARKLMDEHNVEMAEVMAADDSKALNINDIAEAVARDGRSFNKYEKSLLQVCCNICDVKSYQTTYYDGWTAKGKAKKHWKFVFYGMNIDVLAARALYLELLVVIRAMARVNCGKGWSKEHHRYANGFCYGLVMKSQEMKQRGREEHKASTGALIVRKDELIRQYGQDTLNLRPGKSRSPRNEDYFSEEYQRGIRHGKEYDLDADRSTKVEKQLRRIGGEQ